MCRVPCAEVCYRVILDPIAHMDARGVSGVCSGLLASLAVFLMNRGVGYATGPGGALPGRLRRGCLAALGRVGARIGGSHNSLF